MGRQSNLDDDYDEIINDAIVGLNTTEAEEVRNWKPMSKHSKKLLRRLFTLTTWAENQVQTRNVESEEIIIKAMQWYRVGRETAQNYTNLVGERLARRGLVKRQ